MSKGRGWFNDPTKHSLASKGISTKFKTKGKKNNMTVDEAINAVREYGTYGDPPHEISITLGSNGDIYAIDEGDEDVVSSNFISGEKGQIWFHNHFSDGQPPSLFDVYHFLDVDEISSSYVATPNSVYILEQRNDIPEISYEKFRDVFHQLIVENETKEVQNAYESGDGQIYLSLLNKYMGEYVNVSVVED